MQTTLHSKSHVTRSIAFGSVDESSGQTSLSVAGSFFFSFLFFPFFFLGLRSRASSGPVSSKFHPSPPMCPEALGSFSTDDGVRLRPVCQTETHLTLESGMVGRIVKARMLTGECVELRSFSLSLTLEIALADHQLHHLDRTHMLQAAGTHPSPASETNKSEVPDTPQRI